MAHAEGRICEEIDMELDEAYEEVDRLRSSLRAAEERAEAWVHAIAQKDSDIEHLRQQAEAAERDEDHAVIAARDAEAAAVAARDRAIAAEHRAEGLEEALKKAREAGLALLGWIAVCDKQGVVPNRNSVLAQNARAILDPDLARPRSEETPTSTACTVPNCHAGMLRSNGRDTVSCPVCDGVLTAEEYATFKQGGQTPNLGPAPAATDKETP